jgi:hypothetical protein
MVAQTASMAGATPEQTAALLRQLVQASAVAGNMQGSQQLAQQAYQAHQQQQVVASLAAAPAPAANGFVFGQAAANGAAGEADVKPALASLDKATRAAMFGPKGQVRPGMCLRVCTICMTSLLMPRLLPCCWSVLHT